ncbi:MAG TPA: D-glycero-beta-D-manno-heptose 1-phosphate adenylyltransferase [Acidimicrobiales bacterium]|nr:D-glycero-beta-D-manno-heptose 1-phosphate adenylyltransferase [Acidimicrobiales bacterium]
MSPSGKPLVVVGDSLVDRDVEGRVSRVCPDSPAPVLEETATRSRPGGAALAAAIAAALGPTTAPVILVTAVCDDDVGDELGDLLRAAGVQLLAVPARGSTPEKIRLRSAGQTLVRLDRGGDEVHPGRVPVDLSRLLSEAGAVLVSDYGRGVAASETIRRGLERSNRPIVWDPHPRGPEPVGGCRLITPNSAELLARWGQEEDGTSMAGLTAAALRAVRALRAGGVAVTTGDKGALLIAGDGAPLAVPVLEPHRGDTCGAGDCFAASAALHLADGALPSEAVTRAVSDSAAFVSAGGAAAYPHSLSAEPARAPAPADPAMLAGRVRAAGGTVVAAGGCFDLLHAGHVSMLQSARALGDCLIVCLNSDGSVRRLKGPGRPVNEQRDRAATLAALDCVDAVAVFDEDTPEQVIRLVRPDVWVKGGDYDARRLPEAATLAEWGGQAVVLPYLAGRSTTGILARASTADR